MERKSRKQIVFKYISYYIEIVWKNESICVDKGK